MAATIESSPVLDGPRPARIWPWVLLAMALPAAVYFPATQAPLAPEDDHELFVLTGQTSEPAPRTLVEYVDHDMREYGRFRPLFGLERLLLANLIGTRAHLLRLLPMAILLATACVLLGVGLKMRLSPWCATVLAWLVVLNPTGCQTWILLAPTERMGMFWVSLCILFMLVATGSRRRWPWQASAWVCFVGACLTKESFVFTLVGLMAVPVCAEMILHGLTFGKAIRRNLSLLICMAVAGAGLGAVAAVMLAGSGSYGAKLMGAGEPARRLGSAIWRVTRQEAAANVFLAPIAVLGVAAALKRVRSNRAGWIAAALVAAAVLLWVIPTGGLQVKVGTAVRRWVFPTALGLAVANALALGHVRQAFRRAGHVTLDAAICVWIMYCAATCLARSTEFRAYASLYHGAVSAIARDVPANGRVLVTMDGLAAMEMADSLERNIQGMARRDVHVEFLDVPKSPRSAREQAALANAAKGHTYVTTVDLARYNAVLALPVGDLVNGVDPQAMENLYIPRDIIAGHIDTRAPMSFWQNMVQARVRIYFRKPMHDSQPVSASGPEE